MLHVYLLEFVTIAQAGKDLQLLLKGYEVKVLSKQSFCSKTTKLLPDCLTQLVVPPSLIPIGQTDDKTVSRFITYIFIYLEVRFGNCFVIFRVKSRILKRNPMLVTSAII